MTDEVGENEGMDDPRGSADFRFEELPPLLRENVERMGWKEPMPVQKEIIPLLLDGRDVVVQSRTGSGKTGAFLLPICLQMDPKRDETQGLVLVPTRELAEQVFGVLRDLTRGTGIRSVAVYGGVGYGPQIDAFRDRVHFIVATPGRMIDHLTNRRVSFDRLRWLVLDEADEMLSMGFYKSMIRILGFISERRQTALFSATIPPGVAMLSRRFTQDPALVSLSSDLRHVEEVDHIYTVCDAMYKDRTLLKIIEMENPEAALIFCNTKKEVEYLGAFLQNFGYDGDILSGDLSQAERERVMERIRAGQLRYLVATDVAARGIDIRELGCVILYSLPQAHDHYIHRAGRTGRASEGGIAISLVSNLEEVELKRRARHNNLTLIKKDIPTDEEVERRVGERLRVMLEEKYRGLSNLERERLGRFLPLARSSSEEGITEEVLAMLFDQFYHETLHKPLYPKEDTALERRAAHPRDPVGRDRGQGRSRRDGNRNPMNKKRSGSRNRRR